MKAAMIKSDNIISVVNGYTVTTESLKHIDSRHQLTLDDILEIMSQPEEEFIEFYEVYDDFNDGETMVRNNQGGYRYSRFTLINNRVYCIAFNQCPKTNYKELVTLYRADKISRMHQFKDAYGKMVQTLSEVADYSDNVMEVIRRIRHNFSNDELAYDYYIDTYADSL